MALQRSSTAPRHSHTCAACDDLHDECGDDELFGLYRRRLLIRGWGGLLSPAEKAYIRAHRTEAASRQAERAADRLRNRRLLPRNPHPQMAVAP